MSDSSPQYNRFGPVNTVVITQQMGNAAHAKWSLSFHLSGGGGQNWVSLFLLRFILQDYSLKPQLRGEEKHRENRGEDEDCDIFAQPFT